MERLPQDVFTECLSFLWFRDVDSLACCSKTLNHIVQTGPCLYSSIFLRLMDTINRISFPRSRYVERNARLLAKKSVHLPMSIDHRALPPEVSIRLSRDKKQFLYHYSGDHLGGNRVLCADMHFPYNPTCPTRPERWCMASKRTEVIKSSFPFTKISNVNGQISPRLSCIAYFEVTIHEVPLYIQQRNAQLLELYGRRPCVCVGLFDPRCPINDRMPGWDFHSYGYHGDDGHYFHGSGTGVRFGPTFGTGDVIGCGVIYSPLVLQPPVLFYVKNGVFVNSVTLTVPFYDDPWFPVVGIDSFSEVSVNFGASPFAFDIIGFENKQIKKRLAIEDPSPGLASRDENWAFDAFFKDICESDHVDHDFQEGVGETVCFDFSACGLYHEDRLLWRPDMLHAHELDLLERLILRCEGLLHDAESKQAAIQEIIELLLQREDSASSLLPDPTSYKSRFFEERRRRHLMTVEESHFRPDVHVLRDGSVVFTQGILHRMSESSAEFEEDEFMSEESSSLEGDQEDDDETSYTSSSDSSGTSLVVADTGDSS